MTWEDQTRESSDVQESSSLLSEQSLLPYKAQSWRKGSRWLFAANALWTLGLIILTTIVFVLWPNEISSKSLDRSSTPSPLLDVLDPRKLRTVTFNGRIHDPSSIFRQPPSAAVDKAWDDLALEGHEFINVTAADILAAGQDPTTKVRWDEAVDAYPAQIEFAHKIHCLNEIRKEIWGEHYFGALSIHAADRAGARPKINGQDLPAIATEDGRRVMHRRHTMHCLHMLLQDLMCSVDLGIVTHDWVSMRGRRGAVPFADFSTRHQCRDFEAAWRWAKENAVEDGDKLFSKLEREGARVLKTNDSYWD